MSCPHRSSSLVSRLEIFYLTTHSTHFIYGYMASGSRLDFKHHINQYILSTWQDDWNGAVMNKLHSIKPVLGDWQSSYRRCRKDEVVLCRARIGHSHLTHSYILSKDPPPECEHCQCILTVRHILVECNHFANKRRMYLVREM